MNTYSKVRTMLINTNKTWLITGVAGFIGSNLLHSLLKMNQKVVGLDNFSTGFKKNIERVKGYVTEEQWLNFEFVEGDICNLDLCMELTENVDYVLHQAALGSVPRSIDNPIASNSSNVSGFLNMLHASKENAVDKFVYAASSSTYGDHPALPKQEDIIGNPLSPYAVTKYINELYASVYSLTYDFSCIGLRYFNVFGPGQNPDGAYAAVIPKWIGLMINNDDVIINGTGDTSRDFTFIDNVVQANILAAVSRDLQKSHVYNIACGQQTTLFELFTFIKNSLSSVGVNYLKSPIYKNYRAGDVKHSLASIEKAKDMLGYSPRVEIQDGLDITVKSYR